MSLPRSPLPRTAGEGRGVDWSPLPRAAGEGRGGGSPSALNILHLTGVPRGAELFAALGGCRAGTALEAAAALGQRVDAIVVGESPAWGLALVHALPLEARPAVLGVGPSRRALGVADRCLDAGFNAPEACRALADALRRAVRRRREGRLDPATGLPTRRATLRLLVERQALAKRERRALSLACVWVDGARERFAAVVRAALRRNERAGWLGPQLLGVLVWGHEAAAERAGARLEKLLRAQGFAAASAGLQLWPPGARPGAEPWDGKRDSSLRSE